MRTISRRLVIAGWLLAWVPIASAQTADEIIEKHLAAMGGREALAKLKTRSISGTITLSTPGGDVSGPIEVLNQVPNKSRTFIKVDLSSLGAGELVVDQRFDGTNGYLMDTLRGNRDITGNQLETMRSGAFPTPLMNYKAMGATVELKGKEKVGDGEAYLLIFEPTSGSVVRHYIDATSYLPSKVAVKIDLPQFGEVEQTTEFSDYRDVDGLKIPFKVKNSSSLQNFTITIDKVVHNTTIDDTLFSKPVAPK